MKYRHQSILESCKPWIEQHLQRKRPARKPRPGAPQDSEAKPAPLQLHTVFLLTDFSTFNLPPTISLLLGGQFDLFHRTPLVGIDKLAACLGRNVRAQKHSNLNLFLEASSFAFQTYLGIFGSGTSSSNLAITDSAVIPSA